MNWDLFLGFSNFFETGKLFNYSTESLRFKIMNLETLDSLEFQNDKLVEKPSSGRHYLLTWYSPDCLLRLDTCPAVHRSLSVFGSTMTSACSSLFPTVFGYPSPSNTSLSPINDRLKLETKNKCIILVTFCHTPS